MNYDLDSMSSSNRTPEITALDEDSSCDFKAHPAKEKPSAAKLSLSSFMGWAKRQDDYDDILDGIYSQSPPLTTTSSKSLVRKCA